MSDVQISLLMIPEADASSLSGLFTVLSLYRNVVPDGPTFKVEIVAPDSIASEETDRVRVAHTALGLPVPVQRSISDPEIPDVLIVPSLFTDAQGEWHPGCHPEVVDWISRCYRSGSLICSSCTGALLLAETGFLEGREATQHWAFEPTFRRNFPGVKLNSDMVLVVTGDDERIVMSGASAAWHDLVLYLIGRYAGPDAARAVARFFLLQWHSEGQAPYVEFRENIRHDDGAILEAQQWLRENCSQAHPVEAVMQRSGLTERSFIRRFRKATGLTPIIYVQRLRVDAGKRLLETTPQPVDEISWAVGYEDASFFRRVFKRVTGMTPSAYRRKFAVVGARP